MKILQHFHPQGSHIFRTIVETAKIYSQALSDLELFSIIGSNFLGTHPDYANFIHSLAPPLRSSESILIPNYLHSFDSYLASPVSEVNSLPNYPLDDSELNLLHNSARDSLYRGLSPSVSTIKLYLSQSDDYFTRVYNTRKKYAYALFNYYVQLISETLPDIVTLSHGNYDYYVSLYLAARIHSIPVLLVNGGFNRSWLIRNDGKITDHSSSAEKIRIFKALSSDQTPSLPLRSDLLHYINTHRNSMEGVEAHRNSSCQLLSDLYLKSLSNRGDIIYILMMPILGEVCHQDLFLDTHFKSKHEWIESLFSQLSHYSMPIAIRHHPEVEFYNEKSLVANYLNVLSEKYNIPIVQLRTNEEFSQFLRDITSTGQSFIPISFGSTISSELSTSSLSSITANGCLASLIPFATVYQYQCDLTDPREHLQYLSSQLSSNQTFCSDMTTLLTWVKLTGKYHSSDRIYRLRSDLHLFFGRPSLLPTTEISYTLSDYFYNLDLRWHHIDDCYHLYSV